MNQTATIGYLDCFSGISGDMFLGALLHAGASQHHLEQQLKLLNLEGYSFEVSPCTRGSISAFDVNIESHSDQQLRHLDDIVKIIEASSLSASIQKRSIMVFSALAEAEAKVHDMPIDKVHFHEVGAIDTIIDIVGALICLEDLEVTELICSPLPLSRGFVNCAHGKLPLPAPAVCNLLDGMATYGVDGDKELVTPTGAALVSVLSNSQGELPSMTLKSVGYGAGKNDIPDRPPNLLRMFLGTRQPVPSTDEVDIIETNLDDWSPEGYQYLCQKLLDAGALDVSLTPVQMKKGRPGFAIKVIGPPGSTTGLSNILFEETTTIGVRHRRESRIILAREPISIKTPWGIIGAKKVKTLTGSRIYPEYEECLRVARENNVSLQTVYRCVLGEAES